MGASVRQPMTVAEFLDWVEKQEYRWEFDGFQPVAMTGGTRAHEMIGTNVLVALQTRLAGRIRYPDAFFTCTPGPGKQTVVSDPVVVFEVLSESTSCIDRITKLREYGATPSIQRYVILEQDAIAAMVFLRRGGDLVADALTVADTLRMPEIDIEVPLAEFYDGIKFPEDVALQRS